MTGAPKADPVETRVDRWLWAVRAFPSRTAATASCTAGQVRVDDDVVKPSSKVSAGARVVVRRGGHERILEVVRPIDSRVGAPIAVTCFVDHTPPAPDDDSAGDFARERGAGRPTKRDRRQLDRLRER